MAVEYHPPPRPPPPAPWMPLFFIVVLGTMWALPMWLRFEPVLMHAVNQLSIMVSLAVPIALLFMVQWVFAPSSVAHLQYPNSRYYGNRGYGGYNSYSGGGSSDPQTFGWALFLIIVLFLLVNTTTGKFAG